jgi:DNA end-binding protein Ku
MAPRSIATGTISFGLVTIPVRLYPATQSSGTISFHLLHAGCGSRLKQQYVCGKDGVKVERDQMVKGYEIAKDRYVAFTTEELKALDEIASQTIDIAEFVSAADVDPIYFDAAYHLGPDKGGTKAYRLLALALERSGKAALARYAARGKQYLVLIRARGGRLVLQQLSYADEVRSPDEIELGDSELRDAEVQLALQLIEQGTGDGFHPERYEDSVKKRVIEAIERKVAGEQIQAAAPAEPAGQVIDLMEALKASLAKGAAQAPAAEPPERGAPADAEARSRGTSIPAATSTPTPAAANTPRKGPKPARPAADKSRATGRK